MFEPRSALWNCATDRENLGVAKEQEPVNYWLAKSEPKKYSWASLVKDKRTAWDGVRNFEARNNLRAMKKGDLVFFYHSVDEKQIVGIARVVKEAYPDETAREGDWSCVDLAPVKALETPVTLARIKADPAFAEFKLLRRSRLSVVPVSAAHFKRLLKLGDTAL
jgi:predicted RNA-binding protein with PUA-like domain